MDELCSAQIRFIRNDFFFFSLMICNFLEYSVCTVYQDSIRYSIIACSAFDHTLCFSFSIHQQLIYGALVVSLLNF